MVYGYTYNFPALRGIQAGREYFTAICPLGLLTRLFVFDNASLPAELRAQRTLNTSRVPEIARYVVENRHSYAFSAITACIDGEAHFEPVQGSSPDLGTLVVPMTARFVINDGQHRRAALEAALEERPDLADETIAVVFFIDAGLKRSQQLFADLNKHAVKPTKSIGILYDSRDPMARLARELTEQCHLFKNMTELEQTSISNRSLKLFTLSSIYLATQALLGKRKDQPITDEERRTACEYWMLLMDVIPEWQLAVKKKVSTWELRRDYVHAHGVVLHALGLAGRQLLHARPDTWRESLLNLREVDWSRSNTAVWEGRAMIGSKMSRSSVHLQKTTDYLVCDVWKLPKSTKVAASKRPQVRHQTPATIQAKGTLS